MFKDESVEKQNSIAQEDLNQQRANKKFYLKI